MLVSTTQIFGYIVSIDCVATNNGAEQFQWREIKSSPAFTVAYYTNILGHNVI